jgi:hypothetical protein
METASKDDPHWSLGLAQVMGSLRIIFHVTEQGLNSIDELLSILTKCNSSKSREGLNTAKSGLKRLGVQARTAETGTDGVQWPENMKDADLAGILDITGSGLESFCRFSNQSERTSIFQKWRSNLAFTKKVYDACVSRRHLFDTLSIWQVHLNTLRPSWAPDFQHSRREYALWTGAMLTSAAALPIVHVSSNFPVSDWQRGTCGPEFSQFTVRMLLCQFLSQLNRDLGTCRRSVE